MTPDERIDANLEAVLKASGSSIRNYTMPETINRMRDAMRKVMSTSYIAGSNDFHSSMRKDCSTCANRGKVRGLSQESYCDNCIHSTSRIDWYSQA